MEGYACVGFHLVRLRQRGLQALAQGNRRAARRQEVSRQGRALEQWCRWKGGWAWRRLWRWVRASASAMCNWNARASH